MSSEYLNLGAVAIIFLFAIKEFFSWLKNKDNKKNGKDINGQLIMINNKIDNHLVSLTERLRIIEKEITTIQEDIREIKKDITDLKYKKRWFFQKGGAKCASK